MTVAFYGNQTDDPNNTSSVENQIVFTYDDFGHVIQSEQSYQGAASSSPAVQYTYDSTASSSVFTNGYRQESVTYPDSRVLFSDYGTGDALDDRTSNPLKLREANSSGTILAEYAHTGLGQTMLTDYPVPDLKLDLFGGTTSTYAGLDRFGRDIDHRWYDYTSGTVDRVRYGYGYDSDSNRLWTEDPVAAASSINMDELRRGGIVWNETRNKSVPCLHREAGQA